MKTQQFFRPLDRKVWYVVLFVIVIAATVLMILIRQEGIRSISERYDVSILFTLGALSQQGSYCTARIVLQIIYLTVLLIPLVF